MESNNQRQLLNHNAIQPQNDVHQQNLNFQETFAAEYFPEREFASVLGVSSRTLRRWHERRCGPPRTVIGRKIYYKKDSAIRWLAAREQQPIEARRRRGGSR